MTTENAIYFLLGVLVILIFDFVRSKIKKYYVVLCNTSYDEYGESYDVSAVKVFTDKANAEKFLVEKKEDGKKDEFFYISEECK